MKTGALIRFACEAGAILAERSAATANGWPSSDRRLGLAFQLADDLLDLTADAETLGKATGKDAAAGKATLAALHGEAWARRQLAGLVGQARAVLAPYGREADRLTAAAAFVADRRS